MLLRSQLNKEKSTDRKICFTFISLFFKLFLFVWHFYQVMKEFTRCGFGSLFFPFWPAIILSVSYIQNLYMFSSDFMTPTFDTVTTCFHSQIKLFNQVFKNIFFRFFSLCRSKWSILQSWCWQFSFQKTNIQKVQPKLTSHLLGAKAKESAVH